MAEPFVGRQLETVIPSAPVVSEQSRRADIWRGNSVHWQVEHGCRELMKVAISHILRLDAEIVRKRVLDREIPSVGALIRAVSRRKIEAKFQPGGNVGWILNDRLRK